MKSAIAPPFFTSESFPSKQARIGESGNDLRADVPVRARDERRHLIDLARRTDEQLERLDAVGSLREVVGDLDLTTELFRERRDGGDAALGGTRDHPRDQLGREPARNLTRLAAALY